MYQGIIFLVVVSLIAVILLMSELWSKESYKLKRQLASYRQGSLIQSGENRSLKGKLIDLTWKEDKLSQNNRELIKEHIEIYSKYLKLQTTIEMLVGRDFESDEQLDDFMQALINREVKRLENKG